MRQQTTLRKPLTSPLCPPLPHPPPSVRPNPTPACKHCLGSIKSILCAGRASSDNSKGNHETNERRDTYELRLRAQARRRKSFLPAMLTRQKIESPGQITVRGREGPMPFHEEVRSRPAYARRRGKYKSNPSQQKVEAVKYCLAVEFAVPLGIPSSIHYNIRHRRGGMGRLCSRARAHPGPQELAAVISRRRPRPVGLLILIPMPCLRGFVCSPATFDQGSCFWSCSLVRTELICI